MVHASEGLRQEDWKWDMVSKLKSKFRKIDKVMTFSIKPMGTTPNMYTTNMYSKFSGNTSVLTPTVITILIGKRMLRI